LTVSDTELASSMISLMTSAMMVAWALTRHRLVRDDGDGLGDLGGDVGVVLDDGDDLAGGGGGSRRHVASPVGHDRESPSLFPGAGRLDGRVEGQQVGLIRDAADGGDDGFDAPGLLVELLYLLADRTTEVLM
jgi:hypothetical protein